MSLLAIDPGRSFTGRGAARQSIGYACFHGNGKERVRGSMSFEELCQRLKHRCCGGTLTLEFMGLQVTEIVIEDFVNDPKSARGGQRNGTSECIGAVEIIAIQAGVPFTRQEAAALGPAKLHAPAGSYKKLKHLRHEDSAFLHGFEFLVRRGGIQVDLSATLK